MKVGWLLLSCLGVLAWSEGEAGVLTSSVWAVLVAGSNGWGNYRHQADVCHAYHTLLKKGVPAERIIVMMYDDIANNELNPKKGIIINKPNGTDVYEGVKIDYKGDDVTVDTFKNVLLGNKAALKGKGSGRVLESGANDHVFINFVDHGGEGVLVFPSEYLHAKDLMDTLEKMRINQKYGEMVLFIEACEAGSMFDNLIGHYDNILVSTASAPDESSWAWYCDDNEIDNCLGDYYSIAWMERLDELNYTESLFEQFDAIRTEVLSKSHVNLYGDYRLGFQQFGQYGDPAAPPVQGENQRETRANTQDSGVGNLDVPLYLAQRDLDNAQTARTSWTMELLMRPIVNDKQEKLNNYLKGRKIADDLISSIVRKFAAGDRQLINDVQNTRKPLNKNILDCHKNLLEAFNSSCFTISQNHYFLKHVYKLGNMCHQENAEERAVSAIISACKEVNYEGVIV